MELEVAITEQVRQTLKLTDEAIEPEANLIEYGLHSLAIMQLVNSFQETYGLELNYVDFASSPTIKDWSELLESDEKKPDSPLGLEASPGNSLVPLDDSIKESSLSDMQYSFWAGQQSTAVSAHLYVEFRGQNIDPVKLNEAVRNLLQIHPMLRVIVSAEGSQSISDFDPEYTIHIDDWRDMDETQITSLLNTKREKLAHQKLAIELGQVIDFNLSLLPENLHVLHLDVNMVAADAPSILQIYADLAALYEGRYQPRASNLSYFSYLQRLEQDSTNQQAIERDRAWWKERLADIAPPPKLPLIAEPLRKDNYHCDSLHYLFSSEQKQVLTEIAISYQVSLSTLMLTVFAITVGRWASDNRFRLNLPLFSRHPYSEAVDQLVGDFTQLLIFNAELFEDEPFGKTLQRFESERETCLTHTAYSGIHVLRDLSKLHGDTESAPIVYTCGLEQGEIISESVRQTLGEPVWCVSQGPMVALDVQVAEHKQGLLVNWDVRTAAFQGQVIDAMFESYLGLIQTLLYRPATSDAPLALTLPLLQRQMRQPGPLLGDANGSSDQVLHNLFWQQVERNPDNIALHFADSTMSYQQLAQAVLMLASSLQGKGIGQGDCLAISLKEPNAYVVASLAVSTLGAAFFAIRESESQLQTGLYHQCNCQNVIADTHNVSDGVNVLLYEELLASVRETETTLVKQHWPSHSDVAYFVTDSDQQKAIAVSHQAALSSIQGMLDTLEFSQSTRLLSLNSHFAKQAIFDIFATLSAGGTLVFAHQMDAFLPQDWMPLIQQHHVNTLHGPTAHLTALVNHAEPCALASVSLALCGTESVTTQVWAKLREHNPTAQLVALAGLNHAALYTSFSVCDEDKKQAHAYLPFGRPLPGLAYKVLNEQGDDCPDYVVGQLWIAGNHIYHNYPFSAGEKLANYYRNHGVDWYNTADFAYYLPNGDIQLCGTAEDIFNHQGYMIERQAINALIVETVDGVLDASIQRVVHEGKPIFVAGIAAEGDNLDQVSLQSQLAEILPRQFVPSYYFVADALPVSANGYIDSEAMLSACLVSAEQHVSPEETSALLNAVSYIFAKTIGIDVHAIQPDDDFFDSGGDSLLATHLAAAINQYFKGSDLSIVDIFTERTPANLSRRISEKLSDVAEKIAQVLLKVIRKQS